MSLLEEIQTAAVDSTSDLGAILRRCKVLAARLGNRPLEEWLLWESNGYPAEAELPDYRVWGLTVKGHFSGPFGSGLRNAPIPTICIPEDVRESVTTFKCRQSVSALEQLLAGTDGGTLQADLGDLNVLLGTRVYQGNNCLQAWGEFGVGCIVEVLNAVRNRILDFALAIEKEYPSAGERSPGTAPIDQGRITQIFNTTVHGGSMNLVGSSDRSQVSLAIQPHDFDSIRAQLESFGVSAEEIGSLQEALEADPRPTSPNRFGPRVAEWMGSAIKKAASGSWKIGVDVASSVLSKMVSRYYGLSD
jgi:hypothetical protein